MVIGHEELLRVLGLVALTALSFANRANDLPKTIATLSGSGALSYRRSLVLGSAATLVGGAVALIGAGALLELFSGGGITTTRVADEPRVGAVIASSAAGWVLLATRLGLPVSTTHALGGGSVGAAFLVFGLAGINWGTLMLAVVIPLVGGPMAAFVVGRLLGLINRRV